MKSISKKHDGFTPYMTIQSCQYDRSSYIYQMEELTETRENEVIFTATLKVNVATKKGRKILRNMLEKQQSPVKSVLTTINNDDKAEMQEGRPDKYTLPDNIIEEVKKDGEIKEFERY